MKLFRKRNKVELPAFDNIDHAISVLNRIHEADPTVLQKLVFHRVPCNKVLADDPTVQVGVIGDNEWEVGLLGIINGLFGVDNTQRGFIAVNIDRDFKIINFMRLRSRGE